MFRYWTYSAITYRPNIYKICGGSVIGINHLLYIHTRYICYTAGTQIQHHGRDQSSLNVDVDLMVKQYNSITFQ